MIQIPYSSQSHLILDFQFFRGHLLHNLQLPIGYSLFIQFRSSVYIYIYIYI